MGIGMSVAVSNGVDGASFRTCLGRASEQQHLPPLVGPCDDLEMNAKSCWQRIHRDNGSALFQQDQICTNDGTSSCPLTSIDSTRRQLTISRLRC